MKDYRVKYLIALWVVLVIALHQDFWNWTNKALVFGFLPIGLAYHACYSLVASLTMWMLVSYLWPSELEDGEGSHEGKSGGTLSVKPVPVTSAPGEGNRL
ncbi:MAG: hypothetical protein WCP07_10710 [bacterium]